MNIEPTDAFIQNVETPAWIYDEDVILAHLKSHRRCLEGTRARLLFPLKCFTQIPAIERMSPFLDGWAGSSPFECRLARACAGPGQTVHATMPGIRTVDEADLFEYCDYISCNSLGQYERLSAHKPKDLSLGIRVNPQRSFVADERYDPCAPTSKLGVPLDQLTFVESDGLKDVQGLHFHTNCESTTFRPLQETVEHLYAQVPDLCRRMEWINLGGGYLFDEAEDLEVFSEVLEFLEKNDGPRVFVEPGWSIVGDAACLVSTVVDLFENGGRNIAVLDTSVNHLPEVIEFEYWPTALGATRDGPHEYILYGCTCLAGDTFGPFRFDELLTVGSRVVFIDCGAYSMVKAHMFNGVNLPTVYARRNGGKELEIVRRFDYQDFLSKYGERTKCN